MNYLDQIPPHDPDMEQGLLGAALMNRIDALEIVSHLKSSDFYLPSSQELFELIDQRISDGTEIDPVEIKNAIGTDRALFVLECMTAQTLHTHVPVQIEEIKRMSNARTVINKCHLLIAKAYSEGGGDIVADAIDELMDLDTTSENRARRLIDLLDERLISAKTPEDFFEVPGFEGIHLFGGDFFVMGGRPGTGKSAYAMQLALFWATECPVMFYSYEMTEMQLTDRVIAANSDHSVTQIEEGLTDEDVENISSKLTGVVGKQLSIRRAAGMTNAELFADMYRFKALGGKVVVIDYLQLAADKSKLGLTHDTTLFSNKLRRVALDSGLLVVAVAQLHRGGVEREAVKLPILSDLRESGAIEQDATTVCLLMAVPNPKYSTQGRAFIEKALTVYMDFDIDDLDMGTGDPDDDKKFIVVDFAKVRQGKTRRWPFIFDGARMTLTPVTKLRGVRIEKTSRDIVLDFTQGE